MVIFFSGCCLGLVGKKRRDRIVIDAKLDFNTFLYNCFKILGLNNRLLLGVIVPPFGYRFFCRINREDYTFMTPHNGDIIKYFRPSKGDCVIDVGAHIGLYTIIGSKRVGSDGRVIAIEAYPENFELLKKNAKLNNLENTIVLNYAAYSSRGKLNLFLPERKSGRTIYNTIMRNRANENDDFMIVEADTLDNLVAQAGIAASGVNWIKVDVEGAELRF